MLRTFIHYGLHFIFPILISWVYSKSSKGFKNKVVKGYFILIATMLVDLDHLFATPIFDANRCSIGFHPLHGQIAICFYLIGLFFKPIRLICIGLLFHMITDGIDCSMM